MLRIEIYGGPYVSLCWFSQNLLYFDNYFFKNGSTKFYEYRQLGNRQTDGHDIHIFTGGFHRSVWSDFEVVDNRFSEIHTVFNT